MNIRPAPTIGAIAATCCSWLEGELVSEWRDGRTFTLALGMSYQVSDFSDAPRRSSTRTGAKLFIVD